MPDTQPNTNPSIAPSNSQPVPIQPHTPESYKKLLEEGLQVRTVLHQEILPLLLLSEQDFNLRLM